MVTGEKPPGEKFGWVSLSFRPGTFHRGANVQGVLHLEPKKCVYTPIFFIPCTHSDPFNKSCT